jgi:hypothetical protein
MDQVIASFHHCTHPNWAALHALHAMHAMHATSATMQRRVAGYPFLGPSEMQGPSMIVDMLNLFPFDR